MYISSLDWYSKLQIQVSYCILGISNIARACDTQGFLQAPPSQEVMLRSEVSLNHPFSKFSRFYFKYPLNTYLHVQAHILSHLE